MNSPTISHPPCHIPLRILHLEDDPDNTRLSQLKLNADGIACQLYRVDNRADFVRALENGGFDLILADYCLPTFDGSAALALAREKTPDLPFIFVTGAFNEYTAGNLLKAGATDYVIKPNISKIAPVVLRAMREVAVQRQRKRAEARLNAIQDNYLIMTSTFNLSDIFSNILNKIDILLPTAAAYIGVLDNTSGKIQPSACRRMDEMQWRDSLENAQDSLESNIVKSNQLHVLQNLQEDDGILAREFYRTEGFVSCLGTPLTVRGDTVGVLVVLTKDKHDFTEEEIEFAKILAAQAGLAVADARLYWRYKQLAQELLSSQSQVGKLVTGLINAHDEEARSIARVLHDESGQLLAGVHISLDETAKQLPPPLKLQIDHAKNLLDQAEERLRHLSHELYPPILDNLGLVPSLEFLAEQISKRKGIKITIETQLSRRIAPLLELTLYRVVQEALNNIARHARASKVHVRLVESERLVRCSIRDNGVGFDVEAVSKTMGKKRMALGLAGMRERVAAVDGTFQIISVPGCGTQLLVTVPQE